MFGYFVELDVELYNRYSTLENNLRSASNSFYDSYRSVIECFLKCIVKKFNLPLGNTVGFQALINDSGVLKVLYDSGVDEDCINKIRDYVLKINKHIHKKEKNVSFETVVDYLNVLFDFTSPVAYHLGVVPKSVTLNDIHEIYAEYQTNLKAQNMFFENIESCIDKKFNEYQEKNNAKEHQEGITPQKAKQLFLRNSEKALVYDGSDKSFKIFKTIYTSALITLIIIGFIQLVLSFGYERYLFVYDIPLNFVYVLLFSNFIFLKNEAKPLDLEKRGMFKVLYHKDLWILDKLKGIYIFLSLFSLFISILDFGSIFSDFNQPYVKFSLLIEFLHTFLILFLWIYGFINFRKYRILKMTGYDLYECKVKVDYLNYKNTK